MPNLSFQDRDERIIEELKTEMALLRRDLVERLRRIEDYITFLETDIGRLRLDLQRINGKLVDLPSERQFSSMPGRVSVSTEYKQAPETVERTISRVRDETPLAQAVAFTQSNAQQVQPSQIQISSQPTLVKSTDKKDGLNPTEIAIIKYLMDNPGTKSATPIAMTIGKAREHVARTLKKLAEENKIIRDETTWPYTYIVPDEVKKNVETTTSSQIDQSPQ